MSPPVGAGTDVFVLGPAPPFVLGEDVPIELSLADGVAASWLAGLTGQDHPIGLLALLALIAVIGVSVAAIRVIVVQHGQKFKHLP
ncbi:hypothetical protein EDC02_7471 [Micromonospora sp. Llam0]|uniref:hypothetical protein n=1 Tax=Micromonospora sp. Llam0 TaxID=2485143 RepID=UPI000FA440AF|nr:hypothetical protein [Micromonospora sp. Llam0]ROO52540.1 hypothetical protein EDC02_7471 [Micromonospora sp. Llam0]